jgi:hypothetical protein
LQSTGQSLPLTSPFSNFKKGAGIRSSRICWLEKSKDSGETADKFYMAVPEVYTKLMKAAKELEDVIRKPYNTSKQS